MRRGVRGDTFPTPIRPYTRKCPHRFADMEGKGVENPMNRQVLRFSLLLVKGTDLFAGTNSGVFLSTNNGDNWSQVNSGLPTSTHVRSLVAFSTNLFAGTIGVGVWRRPLAEMISSVETSPTGSPAAFELSQDYPNPFNPSTTIRYGLPARSHVTLTVFNTLGQQVATLVEGEMEAGYHGASFDASGLASGVYLYRLWAGEFVQTRKLVLLQ